MIHRTEHDGVFVTMEMEESEANDICADLGTNDESKPASKEAFSCFMNAARDRGASPATIMGGERKR
jgi:hypothetical protein